MGWKDYPERKTATDVICNFLDSVWYSFQSVVGLERMHLQVAPPEWTLIQIFSQDIAAARSIDCFYLTNFIPPFSLYTFRCFHGV